MSDITHSKITSRITHWYKVDVKAYELIYREVVNLEYRNSVSQITFDNRYQYDQPYFLSIEAIWDTINLRNGKVPVQQGPYIFDILYFNKEVIREALNNAVAHRDYRRTSEVLIKQYPNLLNIINPGGLPIGVTLENLLTVNSTPRNRLLADVLAKTGIVERSGQGVDKIYYQSVSEAKPEPDYTFSDDFQVELRLSAIVQDKAFALFINYIQSNRKADEKLGVKEIITLGRIRTNTNRSQLDFNIVNKLIKEGLVEKIGKTNSQRYILSKTYYSFTDSEGKYTFENAKDDLHASSFIMRHFSEFKVAQMKDFVQLLESYFNRDQIKRCVYNMVKDGILEKSGTGKGTTYTMSPESVERQKIVGEALKIGFQELAKKGLLPNTNN
jgi:ATP-dependent DNA helicase RecG